MPIFSLPVHKLIPNLIHALLATSNCSPYEITHLHLFLMYRFTGHTVHICLANRFVVYTSGKVVGVNIVR